MCFSLACIFIICVRQIRILTDTPNSVDSNCINTIIGVQNDASTQTTLHRPKKKDIALSMGDITTCVDIPLADL